MKIDRRQFVAGAGVSAITAAKAMAAGSGTTFSRDGPNDETMGVLVDTTVCIGCRKCEYACQEAAGFDVPSLESFDDMSVYDRQRRPDSRSYTVVNVHGAPDGKQPQTYVKVNCLHCNDPACASACLVGAFTRNANGAVSYDAHKCMGCRYCMVACPFQIPTYDYENALTPQVRKCNLCFDRIEKADGVPACVAICPRECMTFGKRTELLKQAKIQISQHPNKYIQHIYGEHEAGGTSWLYLANHPFEELGFITPGDSPPHRITEAIQHGIFKGWVAPLGLYGLLGLLMWLFGRRDSSQGSSSRSTLRPHRSNPDGRSTP